MKYRVWCGDVVASGKGPSVEAGCARTLKGTDADYQPGGNLE